MEEINKEEIDKFIQEWSSRKIFDGKSFDGLFQIEGIPIWWFYHRLIVRHVIPKQVNTYEQLYHQKVLTNLERIKYSSNSLLLRKYLLHKEKRKIRQGKISHPSSNKKVLILSYSNHLTEKGEVFRIQRLVNTLKEDKNLEPFIVFATPLSRNENYKIKDKNSLFDYYEEEISKKSIEKAEEIHLKWTKFPETKKEKMLNYQGRTLWPYLKYGLNIFFSKEFLYLSYLYYNLFTKVIKEEKIEAAVITSTNGIFDKCLQAAAFKSRIPVILLQHGIGGFMVDTKTLSNTSIAVFSDKYKKKLLQQGVPAERITVVGPVVFDEIVHYKRKKVRNKNPTIYFATTSAVEESLLSEEEYKRRVNKIVSDISKIKGVIIHFKLHPMEKKPSLYKEILEKNKVEGSVISNQNRAQYYEGIAESDLFINFNSSAAVEAMILQKPVITTDIFGNGASFTKGSGAAVECSYKDDIGLAVENALTKNFSQEREKFIKEICGSIDGKSNQRVIELINNF